ncbi:MAG TPA: SfnB family sulfur acquisition oxidoreductase [Stellaceae bacterium]|nr:SfnB family sulfur acquisition oxidoreductase [Stellaceae bacterium]
MAALAFAPSLSPETPVLRDDAEALEAAEALAAWLLTGASERDRLGTVPYEALRRLAASGLLGITVPKSHGGARVTAETVVRVFAILAAADPAIAQVPQNHFCFVESIVVDGTGPQKDFFFPKFLMGARLGNALSERGTKGVLNFETRLQRGADGVLRLNGTKYYCTGALTADFIPAFAIDDEQHLVIAYIDRHAEGVTAEEDWHAMGQRATISGTVRFVDVVVPDDRVLPYWRHYEAPQASGAFGQIIHAAIEVGIARGALAEAAEFIRTKTRPWFESGLDRVADEPVVIHRFGELEVKTRAAEQLLFEAGRAIDRAWADLDADTAAEASLAVAAAKAFGGDVVLEVTNEIFSFAGSSAADDRFNLHRHWRNARTHTLHDPNRWKYHHLGNFALNGVRPPNHGLV